MRSVLSILAMSVAFLASSNAEAPPVATAHAAAKPKPTYADSAFARMDAMRRHLGTLHAKRDSVEIGGIVTHWQAWSTGKDVRFIRETIEQEDFGTRSNEYFYEHAQLRAFVARGERSLTEPRNPNAGPYVLRVVWGPAGDVRHSDKLVAGQPEPVEDAEPPGAKSRSDWLFHVVQTPAP